MQHFFDQFRKFTWLKSLLLVIIGLFGLFQPGHLLNIFIYVAAGFVAVFGLINIFSSVRQRSKTGQPNSNLTVGILQLIGALLIVILTKPILAFLPFFMGLALGISGIGKIGDALGHRQYVNVKPTPLIIWGVVLILMGLVLIFNPFNTVLLALRIFCAFLVINAIMDVFTARRFRN